MRRLTATEWGLLILAGVFIITGIDMVLHPTGLEVFHKGDKHSRSSVEHISPKEERLYGVMPVMLGAGMVYLVFYGRGK